MELFQELPLSGVTVSSSKPAFNFHQWFKGTYQDQFSKYVEENSGFRSSLIRLNNQVNYSLFNSSPASVTIGKGGYLFQGDYIDEITGKNFVGENSMVSNLKNLRKAQDYLKSRNIFLLTVLAPGKADFYKEYLPEYYSKRISTQRNYNSIIRNIGKENINLIDFNNWFLQLKDTTRFPLFPKQGIHWTSYGMALCADSIVRYIEVKKNISLPDISWTLDGSDSLKGTDYDLGSFLNIYEVLPHDKIWYPYFTIHDDLSMIHPRLLVCGDSFYWTIYNEHIFSRVFYNETFYYYSHTIYPSTGTQSLSAHDLDLLKELENYDIIILLNSQANYGVPGGNFIKLLLGTLHNQNIYKERAINSILDSKFLLSRSEQIALQKNISLDSSISILADSFVADRFSKISKIKNEMRKNPEWLNSLNAKAASDDRSLEEVMQSDAEWMCDQNDKK
jgi:hypothetical protein